MHKHFIIFLSALFSLCPLAAQERELLIVGTMHQVPGIVSHSYALLLKYAIEYAPDAILTEDIMPDDTVSLQLYTPKFLERSKSASAADVSYLDGKHLDQLSHDDFEKLRDHYLADRDRANYNYYSYLVEYGIQGSRKPLRNESDDLTHKLAIAMGIRHLLPIDDHHTDKEYNNAWVDAVNSGSENGDLETYAELTKKTNRSRIFPALTGRLGKFTNRQNVLETYYKINSLRYVQQPNEKTELAKSLWDGRNERMARNIKDQMDSCHATRAILIVGSGHVISLMNALAEIDPTISVRLMK